MMDALTPTFWVGLIAVILTNLINAWWGKRRIDHQNERINGLREQLEAERNIRDERINGLQDQLKDARAMNDLEFRDIVNARQDEYKERVHTLEPQLKDAEAKLQEADAKVASLEASAAEGERAREELVEAMEDVKLLEDLLQEAQKDRDAAERLSGPSGRIVISDVPFYGGRYIPQAPEDFSHLDNYPEDPGREG